MAIVICAIAASFYVTLATIDSSTQPKTDKTAAAIAAGNTFGVVAKDYLMKLEDEGKTPITIEKNRWLLEDLAAPLTKRPIPIFEGVRGEFPFRIRVPMRPPEL